MVRLFDNFDLEPREFLVLFEGILKDNPELFLSLSDEEKLQIFRDYVQHINLNMKDDEFFEVVNENDNSRIRFWCNESPIAVAALKVLFAFSRLEIFKSENNVTIDQKMELLQILLQRQGLLVGGQHLLNDGINWKNMDDVSFPEEGRMLSLPNNTAFSHGTDVYIKYNQLATITGGNVSDDENHHIHYLTNPLNKLLYTIHRDAEMHYGIDVLSDHDKGELLRDYPKLNILDDAVFWTQADQGQPLSLVAGDVQEKLTAEIYNDWFNFNRYDVGSPVARRHRQFWEAWVNEGRDVPDLQGNLNRLEQSGVDEFSPVPPRGGNNNFSLTHQLEKLNNETVEHSDNASLIFGDLPMSPALSGVIQLILLIYRYQWAFLAWFKSKFNLYKCKGAFLTGFKSKFN